MTTEEMENKLMDIEAKLSALINDYAELKHDTREPQCPPWEIIQYIEVEASKIRKGLLLNPR